MLTLGVSTGERIEEQTGSFDANARAWVMSGIQRWFPNYALAKSPLSDEELGCRTEDCYIRLQTSYKADYVISGSSATTASSYSLRLVLIGTGGSILKIVNKDCSQCSDEATRRKNYEDAVGELFHLETSPPPPRKSRGGPRKRPQCAPYATFQRGIAVGASSAFLLTGIVAASTFAGLDGAVYDQATGSVYQLKNHAILSGGLTALPLLGLGLALGINGNARMDSAQCRFVAPRKQTFRRGFALGSFGAIALTSLVATITFAGLHGQPYDDQNQLAFANSAIATGVGTGLSLTGFLIAWPW